MSPRPLLLALLLTLRSCADGDAILQASNVTSETFSSTDIKAVSTDGATPTNITNSANSIVLGSSTIQATTNMVTLTSTRQAVTSVITPTSITEAATDVVMSSKITQATTSMDIATNTTGSVSSMVSHNTEEKISSSLNSTPNNQLIQRSTEPGGVSTNQGTATLASDSISVITKTFGTSGATSAQVPDSSTSGNGSQGTDLTTESHSSHVTPSEPVGQETSIDSRSTRSSATISGHDYNTEISAMVSLSTDEKTSSFFSSSPTHRLTRETTQDKITIDQGSGTTYTIQPITSPNTAAERLTTPFTAVTGRSSALPDSTSPQLTSNTRTSASTSDSTGLTVSHDSGTSAMNTDSASRTTRVQSTFTPVPGGTNMTTVLPPESTFFLTSSSQSNPTNSSAVTTSITNPTFTSAPIETATTVFNSTANLPVSPTLPTLPGSTSTGSAVTTSSMASTLFTLPTLPGSTFTGSAVTTSSMASTLFTSVNTRVTTSSISSPPMSDLTTALSTQGNTVQSTVNTTLAANPSSTEVQSTVKSTVPTLGQSTKSISTAAKPTENITTTTIQQTVNMTSTTVTSTQSATTLQPTVSSTINTTTVPPTFSVTSESSSTTKFQTIITTFRPTANSTMNATTTTSRPTVSSTVNATTTTSRPMISSTVNATTTTSRPTISSTMNATITTSRPMISSTVNATTTTPRPTVNSTVYATTTTFRPTVNSTVNATTTTSGPMVNFTSTFEPTKSPPADFCTTCPLGSSCVNLTCQCLPGTYFNNQTQTCENARVFSGELHINSSFQADMANQSSQQFKDMAGKITNALQKALRGQPGYVSSSVLQLRQGSVVATVVNAFQINSDATDESTASAIKQAIEACTGNCDTVFSQADFTAIPLCSLSPGPCQVETTVCASQDGKPKCTCRDGFIRNEYSQKSCTACPPGQQAAGDVCVACPFGYSGFNCNDSALLAVVVISCVLGGTLLILVLGLLLYFCVTCRRTNKNQDYDSPYTSEDLRGSWPTQGVVSIPRASANPNPAFQNSGSMLEMTAAGSTHSLVDNRGGTNGMTGSYDVNPPEDMRTFKSQTPSRYSYLVQGHENPYFLPGDERRST
ncbi:serine-rich adhesin for platelets isoform X2 [Denticeps clupeoides]|uniref:SEA domain-containing protein n=1 Tax=Denticeps clupeoides TaxID=299321 RepID=A0AAY4CK38_9TELE|nr:serine-rich adhesin for platelets-like isoform X2 [Denticeps clupeoides]